MSRFIKAIIETSHKLYEGDILVPYNSVKSFNKGCPALLVVTDIQPSRERMNERCGGGRRKGGRKGK